MVDMTHSATISSRGSEFDAFLFAPIGEEKNGMLLSVLSALARLGLDPWREAAELARMPNQAAEQRLTSLIEALPEAPSTRPEPQAISTRLIALLPRGASAAFASSEALPVAGEGWNFRALIYAMAFNLLLMAGIMAAQWAASSPQPSPKADSAQASATSEVRPEAPASGVDPGAP